MEGVYVRVDDDASGWNVRRGKVVRPDFIQSIQDGVHWMSKKIEQNTVAYNYIEQEQQVEHHQGGETKETIPAQNVDTSTTQYPRTPHLPFSPGGTTDDVRLTHALFTDRFAHTQVRNKDLNRSQYSRPYWKTGVHYW